MISLSLRWRLQLWLGFLLVCLLTGFSVTLHQLERRRHWNQLDEELERRVAAVSMALRGGPRPEFGPGPGRPPFEEGARHPSRGFPEGPPPEGRHDPRSGPREFRMPSDTANLFDETRTDGFYYCVWSREASVIKSSTNSPSSLSLPPRSSRDTSIHVRLREWTREAYHFTELGDCVLAGRSIATDQDAMHRFTLGLLVAGATVLALGLGGGWWITTRAIQPIEQISAAAGRISAGNLSERIAVTPSDHDLGRLGAVLNSTFERLEEAFARQKQFTADASHELRTPLAVMITEAQTTLSRPRSAEEYRETVETCLETAQRMRRLTESLLELARLDGDEGRLVRAQVDLAEIIRSSAEQLRPLASQRNIRLHCDLSPAIAEVHVGYVEQVVINLISNAIHYNQPGGKVRVSSKADGIWGVITVADTGTGIDAVDLPHIFERFYRADKVRVGVDGHFGLGLSICKGIVDAHGGHIEVSSEVGVGTIFTVRLSKGPRPPS